jgi:hypothetical protein
MYAYHVYVTERNYRFIAMTLRDINAYYHTARVKLSLCLNEHNATEVYGRSENTVPLIRYLDTRCRWVVSFTLRQH